MKRCNLLVGAAIAALTSSTSAFAAISAPVAADWDNALFGTGIGLNEFLPVLETGAAVVVALTLVMVGMQFVRKVIRKAA